VVAHWLRLGNVFELDYHRMFSQALLVELREHVVPRYREDVATRDVAHLVQSRVGREAVSIARRLHDDEF
jgi:hypothetical protein